MDRMRFFPDDHEFGGWIESFGIIELGENALGMFMFARNMINMEDAVVRLFTADRETHADGAREWLLRVQAPVPHPHMYSMLGVVDGKLFLVQTNASTPVRVTSLDLKTYLSQEIQGMIHTDFHPLPDLYTGYPPSLSLPTI
ncbi:hypothetical protein BS78_02G311200 [Paspalum vaginatum]|nr:hypothetical protein BS78_02G311200 [Paspalum vaginatum]